MQIPRMANCPFCGGKPGDFHCPVCVGAGQFSLAPTSNSSSESSDSEEDDFGEGLDVPEPPKKVAPVESPGA